MKLLLLSCIFIGGVAVSSALDPLPNKAGTCPPPPRIGTCDERCSGDDSCQGRKKCCSHGCGHSCQDPVRTDICALPKVVGPCDAAVRSWWFNKAKGRCEFFSYGGCQGNANRFKSKRACEDRCQEVVPVPPCKQPQKIGPCRARKSRWYFNAARGRCEQFFWGGCAPNGNNFMTVEECRRTCPEVVPVNPCKQPKKVEPCYARIPRWYFNAARGRCEQFFWGGCAPNGNNFMTVEECRRTCPEEVPACEQPLKVGPCRAAVPKWYYNSAKGRCEKFSWGGCKPNDNNFLTVDECIRSCPEKSSRPHTGQCARQDFSSRPFIDCAPSTSGCRSDHHCAGDEKCCEQLCYDFQCKPAVMRPLVKPGRCPAVRFKTRANSRCYWRNTCIQDSQCPGNKKCCQAPGPSRCKTCQNSQVHYRG